MIRNEGNGVENESHTPEDENLRQEWVELARIIDRVLLITFSAIHIFMILLVFVVMPNT